MSEQSAHHTHQPVHPLHQPGEPRADVRVALLGTGHLGTAIADRLLRERVPVAVWNRTRAKAEALAERGATVADSPAGAAAGATHLITVVTDAAAAEEVVSGLGPFPAGSAPMWLQMGTVGAEGADRLAVVAERAGLDFVDAPVSGSTGPAEEGRLLVLGSGDLALQPRAGEVLFFLGTLLWVGPAGAGNRLKLVVNDWMATATVMAAECLELADRLGLSGEELLSVLEKGPLGMPYAIEKARAMLGGDDDARFPLRHALKDLRLAHQDSGTPPGELPVSEAARRAFRTAEARGLDGRDVSAVRRVYGVGPGGPL